MPQREAGRFGQSACIRQRLGVGDSERAAAICTVLLPSTVKVCADEPAETSHPERAIVAKTTQSKRSVVVMRVPFFSLIQKSDATTVAGVPVTVLPNINAHRIIGNWRCVCGWDGAFQSGPSCRSLRPSVSARRSAVSPAVYPV